jgi:5'-nucleotidase
VRKKRTKLQSIKGTIACDVDGVVADLHSEWVRRYNLLYYDNLTSDDVKSWEIDKYVKPQCGLKVYDILKQPDLYEAVSPIPGALEGINALREDGWRVVFVTSTNLHQNGAKLRWLERHGFLALKYGVSSQDYVETVDKSLIVADVMIDDYQENLRSFNGRRILFTQSHNLAETGFLRATWGVMPAVLKLTEETITQEADRIVGGQRGEDYGHPRTDFTKTALIWQGITGRVFTPEEVGLCMIGVKLSREVNKHKRDNLVDIAGYAKTVQMVHEWTKGEDA